MFSRDVLVRQVYSLRSSIGKRLFKEKYDCSAKSVLFVVMGSDSNAECCEGVDSAADCNITNRGMGM
jgi:hypothetical protein